MSDAARINGNAYGWASCVFKFANERYSGVKSITYGDKLETAMVYGSNRHGAPVGQTGGKYVPDEVKVVMRRDSAKAFVAALARQSPDGKSVGRVGFEGVVQFVEDETPHTHLLHRMRLVGQTASLEEGSEAAYDELTCTVQGIERDGITLYDQSRGAP